MSLLQGNRPQHLLQILTAGLTGSYAEMTLQVPTTDEIVHFIQIGAQVLIAVVTCAAAVRKALQPTTIAPAQTNSDVPAN